ncbi:MAG: heparinase II/III family protein [Candidatus Latescibacter sp.]|nr:heparinase II/III family protein [Candidatus Latescibacter sp.]
MKPLTALLAVLFFGFYSGIAEGQIIPSNHSITLSLPSTGGKSELGYQTFNRDEILKRAAADHRYAQAIDRAKKHAAPLLAMSDEQIRALIPPANTKRALMVNRHGCPVHGGGTGVYQPFGTGVDITHPLQVQCPIGKEWYPNPDFPDDGQGWLDNRADSSTKGEKYYFVGWFNHWFLRNVDGYVKPMAEVWFLTGEDVYAAKARVLLERFMEVYPDLDSKDLTYDGSDWGNYVKMTGSFWEGSELLDIAKSVEILRPTLPDTFLKLFHERVYRSAYRAYRAKPASGNWGNNWDPPLAKFAAVMGDQEMLNFMLYDHPAAEAPVLDNQFFRDGFPYEASLGYASTYHSVAKNIAEAMGSDGRWVWDNPHMRASFHSFADLVALDRFTHFAADMGGIVNNGWTLPAEDVADAWQAYKTPELARYLLRAWGGKSSPAPTLDDLFKKPLDPEEVKQKAAQAPEEKSTLSPVRGIAVLRTGNGDDRAALILDYGYAHSAHSHADRLNINLFAAGREFVPEMGYPEYMDGIAPATGGWTTNTVCHATVEVNEKRQSPGVFGDLHAFADLEGMRFIDASCEDAYAALGVDRYRRTLLLIDIPRGSYVVDLFRVRGGTMHDYLFHGPVGDLKLDGPALPAPSGGTLAGESIPFGQRPEGMRSYDTRNSGYQYLFDPQACTVHANYSALWTLKDGVTLRAFFIPEGSETFIKTMGYPRPSTKSLPPMPFLVRRHTFSAEGEESRFASVLSVEKGSPSIREVQKIELTGDKGVSGYGLLVKHTAGEDLILSTVSTSGQVKSLDGKYALNGLLGVASWRDGRLVKMTLVGGTDFRVEAKTVKLQSPVFKTTVKTVYDDRLELAAPLPAVTKGQLLLANRGPVRSVYRIEDTRAGSVNIYPTTWIGRGRTDTVDAAAGTIIDNRRIFPLGETPYPYKDGKKIPGARNYYSGAWITPADGRGCFRLQSGGNGGFVLDPKQNMKNIARDFEKGKDFLLYDLGPGDTVYVVNTKEEKY